MTQNSNDIYDTISIHGDADKEALKGFIDEAVLCKKRIADQQEALRDIKNEAKERFNISPKVFSKAVNIVFKDSLLVEQQTYDEVETVLELAYPTK